MIGDVIIAKGDWFKMMSLIEDVELAEREQDEIDWVVEYWLNSSDRYVEDGSLVKIGRHSLECVLAIVDMHGRRTREAIEAWIAVARIQTAVQAARDGVETPTFILPAQQVWIVERDDGDHASTPLRAFDNKDDADGFVKILSMASGMSAFSVVAIPLGLDLRA